MKTAKQASNWDPFTTDFERRADGSLILRARGELPACPSRMMDVLEHWARVAPERMFIGQRGANGQWATLSYRQTLERVQRIGAGLARRELSPERPLVILSGNSVEHLLLGFGAMWAGVPYCPVSPAYAQAASDLNKLKFVLELLSPGMVAAFNTHAFERPLRERVDPEIEIVGDVERIAGRKTTSLSELESAPDEDLAAAHARTGPDSIVKFLLTSGSTGEPKAVIVTERMQCCNAQMLRQAMPFVGEEPPVLLDWLPWNHTFGGSHNIGLALYNGGSLYIDHGKPTPADFQRTIDNLREIAPTVYFNVPKGFEMLAHSLRADAALRRQFYGRLRAYFFAGASLSQHTWDALDEASLKERGEKIPMLSGLGATEVGPSVTFTTPAMARSGVIGLPAKGNLVKLTPIEGKLEIRVKSPCVTPGYWRRPALTNAAFDEEGFYRLGDAVRLIDPEDPTRGLLFDGRIAEDFKLASGTWVSVGPLRAELIAALSPVAQDVVIAGLDRDDLTALVIPDVRACATWLDLPQTPTHQALAADSKVLAFVRDRLHAHAERHPASSKCIHRAMLLPSPPSLDHGEITDKGSINQRAVLRCRAELIEQLYADDPPAAVVQIVGAAAGAT